MTATNGDQEDLTLRTRIWNKIQSIRNRTVTIGQTLPPYILIGVLYIVGRETDSKNDSEVAKQALVVDFRQCVSTARARQDNKANWYDTYDFIRSQGPEATFFANELQAKFDTRFEKNVVKVPTDCLKLPEFGKFTEKDIPKER